MDQPAPCADLVVSAADLISSGPRPQHVDARPQLVGCLEQNDATGAIARGRRGARIHAEHIPHLRDVRTVSVAVHYGAHRLAEVVGEHLDLEQPRGPMNNPDRVLPSVDDGTLRSVEVVAVALHEDDRRDPLQPPKHAQSKNITGVDDEIHPGEHLRDLWG